MKKSCVIYDSWGELILNLPDEMAGELIKQMLSYAFGMDQPCIENQAVSAMFAMIKTKLDEDAEEYEKVKNLRSEAAKKRWSECKPMQKDANACTCIQEDANAYTEMQMDTVSVSVSVSDNNNILSSAVTQIVDYLNEKAGTHFKSNSKATAKQIKARLADGFTVEDFKTVIDKKVRAWINDPKMAQYLRPETLFRPGHFESYLNEVEVDRSPPQKSATYNKIHNFSERKIDYAALEAEVSNVRS